MCSILFSFCYLCMWPVWCIFSFFGMKWMELKPWSMNLFVWFTLFDVMLPSCISWWNSSKFVQKKKTEYKCLIRLKSPVQIQINRRQRFRRRRFLLRYVSVVFKMWKGEFAGNWKLWQDKCCFKVISPLIWEIYYEVLLFEHSIGEDCGGK